MKHLLTALLVLLSTLVGAQTIRVGSKRFTEGYVLGEILVRQLRDAGLTAEHRQGVGSTGIVWNALKSGSLDAYADYTGTVGEEILKKPKLSLEEMRAALRPFGVGIGPELGFNDAYGLVLRRKDAQRLGVARISDLRAHPELRYGITPELLDRSDGWKPLVQRYGLTGENARAPRTIEHALGYEALSKGAIDVKDCYTTDAQIKKFDLTVLRDDLDYFPLYRAVVLYRLNLPPKAIAAFEGLKGTIDEPLMIEMNARASETKDYAKAAGLYFERKGRASAGGGVRTESLPAKIVRLTGQHLALVGASLGLALVVGLPLGIVASRRGFLSGFILSGVGLLQTIPSLALLALLVPVPFFGISWRTAVAALFLYSLLPIVRNTAAGLAGISPSLRESAEALGLEPGARLRKLDLPMALPTILAGIKTSAVINVGTATLAAFLGAGGLGEPIVSGLSLNDNATILTGAIPAAILALLVQGGFDLLERAVVPRGLRGV